MKTTLIKIAIQQLADKKKRERLFAFIGCIIVLPILLMIMLVYMVTAPLRWVRDIWPWGGDGNEYTNAYILEEEDYIYIRGMDAEVNALISNAEAKAYRVSFVMTGGDEGYSETRLRTNMIEFASLFAVLHQDTPQNQLGDFRVYKRNLHEQTYSLEIYWYVIYVPVEIYIEVPIYGDDGIVVGVELVPVTQYHSRDVVRIYFTIFSVEEMIGILGFGEAQSTFVREILEVAAYLGYYNFIAGGGLPPEEIAYILENMPLAWPTHFRNISSPFGWRYLNGVRNFHAGIDIPMVIGSPVFASISGTVTTSGHSVNAQGVGAGHMIVITSDCGRVVTRYLHLNQRLVSTGTWVEIGTLIAYSGNSGATGTSRGHLHYDIAINGTRVDPLPLLP